MSQLIKIDEEYAEWIQSVGTRFKSMQVKAATKVNQEMLHFYWLLGKDMVEMPQRADGEVNFTIV